MAHIAGTGLDAVVAFFSKNYAQLDFFQMARLLSYALQKESLAQGIEVSPAEWEPRLAAVLRVRPTLSLAFPEHDIASIEKRPDGKIQVEAGFFGLYGVTSPLPYFYTEDLMQASQQGRTSARGLLDMFHYAAHQLGTQAVLGDTLIDRLPTPQPLGRAKLGLAASLGRARQTGSFSYFVN